ncbi:Tfp pilus assembly protein FimT/FimU [Cyanothece sp. BG0011]|uniref:pilus assembly FimT family protein n=1 Tax=Cyanothece sp. BG0011 TaxID=2082950 RepID=UPI000D1EECEF|nr:hypothetical protein [Cyanothece sp. BG0011]
MFKIYLKLLQKHQPSAGWTLAELMIAAAMTLVVVMVAGFGLVTILRENKVANATGEMQYDLNRATEFISEEIRSAKTIEPRLSQEYLEEFAPTFWAKYGTTKTPVLALKIDGVYERVIYYVDEVADDEIWKGPGVIKRFGPDFNENGDHKDELKRDPSAWKSLALVDMMTLDLKDDQKQCQNLPPNVKDTDDEYIARDDELNEWYRLPQAKADVQGFFVCVREDKELAQLNILGTTLDEFQHLGYNKDDIVTKEKKTRYSDKMEYTVATMVHARSEVIGSSGESVPRYNVKSSVLFQEKGQATIKVLYANIPCSDDVTTSSDITTNFYIANPETGAVDLAAGTVNGIGEGPAVTFTKDYKANAHIKENTLCSSDYLKYQISANDQNHIKFATNDNSDHTKLNQIIPTPSSTIVNKLTQEGLIKEASDGSYDFTLPDNIVLYFVEFEFVKDEPIPDGSGGWTFEEQTDPPHFDDAVYLVEMTK